MSTGSRKLWGGRFEAATDAAVERFTASVHFDRALARYDLRLSRAHARMLEARKLIDPEDLAALTMEASAMAMVPLAGTQHTVGRPDMTRY